MCRIDYFSTSELLQTLKTPSEKYCENPSNPKMKPIQIAKELS
jgi:hypothetical protein